MTPTVKLRFVWRDGPLENNGSVVSKKAVRVLQQWWQAELTGEWRDVPLEPAAVPAPPKKEWVTLTDEEILEEYRQSYGDDGDLTDVYFARVIEFRLKEKNSE
jgi:hypothetical protein